MSKRTPDYPDVGDPVPPPTPPDPVRRMVEETHSSLDRPPHEPRFMSAWEVEVERVNRRVDTLENELERLTDRVDHLDRIRLKVMQYLDDPPVNDLRVVAFEVRRLLNG